MARFRQELCPVDSNGTINEVRFRLAAKFESDFQCYALEYKYDGSRYLLHLLGVGRNHLTSRRKSKKTGEYSDRIEQVPHFKKIRVPRKLRGTVLDGEMVSRTFKLAGKGGVGGILNSSPERARQTQREQGKLRYIAFGIKYFGKEKVFDKPFIERRLYLRKVLEELFKVNPKLHKYIEESEQFTPKSWDDVIKTYRDSLHKGYEGIMVKDMREPEGKGMWKRKVFRDTCVIVTGWEPGKGKYKGQIGALLFSAYYKGKLKEIGKCPPGNDKDRRKITANFERYHGRVLEIKAQEINEGEDGRVRHANLLYDEKMEKIRWRDDYPPEKVTLAKVRKDLALI